MTSKPSLKTSTSQRSQGANKIVSYDRYSQKGKTSKKVRHLRAVENTPQFEVSEPSSPKNPKREPQKQKNFLSVITLYVARVAIVGVGLSVFAGSVLSGIEKSQKQAPVTESVANNAQKSEKSGLNTPISLNKEMNSLKKQLQALEAKYPKLDAGLFIIEVGNGNYVNLHGDSTYSAASIIKIPILVAFFQEVDAGKVRLDEKLTMTKDVIGGGSGGMQYQEVGKQFSALEIAIQMITVSDNTATNMLIKRLGGAKALNQRFSEWGLANTVIHNPLPDLEGTNTTTPRDLVYLLAKVEKGELVSVGSRDRIIDIMQRTVTDTLLPRGLEKNATIAHKTGDIGSVLGDAGIIDMPNGKRYLAAVIVKRPHNDPQGGRLIQQISAATYQYLKANNSKNVP